MPLQTHVASRALLVTDLTDSARLAESLGHQRLAELSALHDRVARGLLAAHAGKEIDKTDGFLMLFERVEDAARYALAYHREIANLDPPLTARAGLHFSEVILRENATADVALGAKPLEVEGLAKPLTARIMSVARGGQTLVSDGARLHLDLDEHRVHSHGHWRMKGVAEPVELFELAEEGAPFTPPPDGQKVYRVVRKGDLWVPVREVGHRLPAERDAFVGRRTELQELSRRLDSSSGVVSIVGRSGLGKTRMAVRFGWTWLGDWPGGVWFCRLDDARNEEDAARAVLTAFDAPVTDGDIVAQAAGRIAEHRRCLVILDRFDQVRSPADAVLVRWMRTAAEARFVVTARQPIGLDGEQVLALPPLEPTAAVDLFISRALAARRDFSLPAEDRPHVDALVRLLECVPQAVEQAASRTRVMPPETLLRWMSARLGQAAVHTAQRPQGRSPNPENVEPAAGTVEAGLAPATQTTATRTLLLTDVVDSTKLVERLGDARMAELWAAHDRVARDLLVVHGGREIDKTDGFLLLFDEAQDALCFALDYHEALARLDPPVRARVGVHTGEVILRENPPDDVERGAKPLEVEGIAKPFAGRVMALASGGQTWMSSQARANLGTSAIEIDSLGYWRLAGQDEPVELFSAGQADAPSKVVPSDTPSAYRVVRRGDLWLPEMPVRNNLPEERDAFVGRSADLKELTRRLDKGVRLLSLLGLGGTGKTRLALRYGWTRLGDYPGGVWFCDLSEARTIEGIALAVARALDVPLGKDDPVVRLAHAIAGRGPCLVIFDNMEQVARFSEDTLGRWLDRAADARFIVTTREVLGLPGESTMALAPLSNNESVDLFVSRATAAKPDFILMEVDRPHVEGLARLLDGLPLAIELAAARVGAMSPEVLLQKMNERFDVFEATGERHDRQATLRAALDWSWNLLSDTEQAGLAQLSVFEGGFSLTAAQAALRVGQEWATDVVASLVDKSLVRPTAVERFDLLVSVQEYARERLSLSGGGEEAEERHGRFFALLGTDEELDSLDRGGNPSLHATLASELDNLLAACSRGVARGDGQVAVGTLQAAWAILELRGPFAKGADLADLVGATCTTDTTSKARLARISGTAHRLMGRKAAAAASLTLALQLATDAGEPRLLGRVRRELGLLARLQGEFDKARSHYETAIQTTPDAGDRAQVVMLLAGLDLEQGEMGSARARYEQALHEVRRIGDVRLEGSCLGNLGNLHWVQGRPGDARTLYEDALRLHRAVGNRSAEGNVLTNLGVLHFELGRAEEAEPMFDGALAIHRETGNRGSECVVLFNLALVAEFRGYLERSLERDRAALAIARDVGNRRVEGVVLGHLAALQAKTGSPADALETFNLGESLLRSVGDPNELAKLLCSRAELESQLGAYHRAKVALEEAEALATELGAGPESELGNRISVARARLEAVT